MWEFKGSFSVRYEVYTRQEESDPNLPTEHVASSRLTSPHLGPPHLLGARSPYSMSIINHAQVELRETNGNCIMNAGHWDWRPLLAAVFCMGVLRTRTPYFVPNPNVLFSLLVGSHNRDDLVESTPDWLPNLPMHRSCAALQHCS